MAKERACLNCRMIFEGSKCPACGESVFSETFKGEVEIFNPEESLIAKNMRINKKGRHAIKTK
jgi:RNA polymerase subunit RPABC4/transcription elongation factor Spt4